MVVPSELPKVVNPADVNTPKLNSGPRELSEDEMMLAVQADPGILLGEERLTERGNLLSGDPESIDIESFFTMAIAQRVSDVHLRVGHPPALRKMGDMMSTNLPAITPRAMARFAAWLVPDALKKQVLQRHDVDFSKEIEGYRLRINMFYEMGHLGFVIRLVTLNIPPIKDLGLPDMITKVTDYKFGLVLVTGKTGSGKSTTLAGLLEYANQNTQKHIITLEDPVEYRFSNKNCVFTQRQLGIDTPSFPEGIKYSLRQDPDILLIGEIRDRETAMAAITAAETGILVMSTLHTSDAVQTINRIIHFFEPHERDHIRHQLANILKACIAQKLYRKKNGNGRAAVAEILLISSTIKDYLLKNQLDEIYTLLKDSKFEGMQSMNDALIKLIEMGQIDMEEALKVSENPQDLTGYIKGVFRGTTASHL